MKRNFLYLILALIALCLVFIVSYVYSKINENNLSTNKNSQTEFSHPNSQLTKSYTSRNRKSTQKKHAHEAKQHQIIEYFKNLSDKNNITRDDWSNVDRFAKDLAKYDPKLGMDVLHIISKSENHSLKHNYCETFAANLRPDTIYPYYLYMTTYPFKNPESGDNYNFVFSICARIESLSKEEFDFVMKEFVEVNDPIIKQEFNRRLNRLK